MSNVAADDLARPGDEDLDIDVDGVTITAVVVDGREVLVRAKGGFGAWVNTSGAVSVFSPGDDSNIEVDFTGLFLSAPQTLFDELVRRMEAWRDRGVPLRLCGAPGKMFSMIEDWDHWLPLPRRTLPS